MAYNNENNETQSNNAYGYIPAYASARHMRASVLESDPYDIKGYKRSTGRKVLRVLSNILFIVGIALVLVAGGMWVKSQIQYREQDKQIEQLQSYAVTGEGGEESTYTAGRGYVLYPDQGMVDYGTELIDRVIAGEILTEQDVVYPG